MEQVYERCCGLDVHKDTVVACLRVPGDGGRGHAEVRTFGTTYAFSAPLDFSVVGAGLASLELHRNGEVKRLQDELRRKVALYDRLAGR